MYEPPPQINDFNYIWKQWFYGFWDSLNNKGIRDEATEMVIKLDDSTTSGDTRLFLYDVDNDTLERVTVGAADSGGAGYKVLRISN